MPIHHESLDQSVRKHMAAEVQHDASAGKLNISPRLTDSGAKTWRSLLGEAIAAHDDTWHAAELRGRGLIRSQEQRKKPAGGFTVAQVPHTAADTLAEGEFNRFYARGLCAGTLSGGGTHVQVYRRKEAQNPRPESQAMVGRVIAADALLSDLRTSQGVEPALGLPPGPNSGLTVRRVR